MATANHHVTATPWRALLPAATGAWCAYLVVDFLIHAVALAHYWRATEQYWLPPPDLLRMIPVAYLSFAIYCAGSTWLLLRLHGDAPQDHRRPAIWGGRRMLPRHGLCFGNLLGNPHAGIGRCYLAVIRHDRVSRSWRGCGVGSRRRALLASCRVGLRSSHDPLRCGGCDSEPDRPSMTNASTRPIHRLYFFISPVQFVTSTSGVDTLSAYVAKINRFPSGATS